MSCVNYEALSGIKKVLKKLNFFRLFRLFLCYKIRYTRLKQNIMGNFETIIKPSKEEQITAMKSFKTLAATLEELHSENPEIEIEETSEKIKIPLRALKLLAQILEITSQGKPVSIIPIATEMTTQAAADFLGCSRPHLIKLLEGGKIPFIKIGRHRRIKFEDVTNYKNILKQNQKEFLLEIIKSDEELGLYDS